ncbi:hypothetical protein GPECTOR_18g113 [Gonium pectorale]|uniref:DNA 5'-3' helicase FANCJ n=1 Tax=Gonium pectorale TaxID=33097 RepID=A0A150GJT8_GONPE|nr:hypothetical protein GPECTOR_18g113 [Gonium pectorale]|eukprot:KXZ49955.1 hypothetical protein GPECTOR_18g113 [Gonium pectorale]
MLRTLEENGNALLEAPTGCGKTLSLLCAVLAWQEKRKKEAMQRAAAKLTRQAARPGGGGEPGSGGKQPEGRQRKKASSAPKPLNTGAYGGAEDHEDDEMVDADDFVPDTKNDSGRPLSEAELAREHRRLPGEDARMYDSDDSDGAVPDKPPKIFFATRTHSQIAQVVRELKRTAYKPAMAILVHDIEELSSTCTKAKVCPYFVARDMALTAELVFCPYSYLLDPVVRRALGLDVSGSVLIFDEAHNMEDVCREGGSMDLDLDALREVEGAFRLAAQLTGRPELYEPLSGAAARLAACLGRYEERAEGMAPCGFEEHEAVLQGQRALSFLDDAGLGPAAVNELWRAYELAKAHEDKATFTTEGDAANEAIPSNVTRPGAGGGALGTFGRLLTVLRLMYAPSKRLAGPLQPGPPAARPYPPQPQSFQQYPNSGPAGQGQGPLLAPQHAGGATAAALAGGGGFIPSATQLGAAGPSSGWRTGGGGGKGGGAAPPVVVHGDNTGSYRVVVKRWIAHGAKDRRKARSRLRRDDAADSAGVQAGAAVSLSLWCFNPAVVFRDLADAAHSVVLTSGTLAPLDSFASELGTEFHVWAGVVTRGPGGSALSATFKESATFRFQDDSGEAVLRYCQVIPDGVLLFLPSYSLMDRLMTRWKSTGLLSRLEGVKTVVMEGREAGKGFEDAMARYYAAIRSGKGGLFVAVCRGKASEGIDFADQHARGVILLGIPFPAVKDTKVRLKKEYNDAGSGPNSGRPPSQRLLSGDAWYTQQAFRALNQAVGRCIRHKYDWGAVILLDERFRAPNRQLQLSRWVRAAVRVHEDFEASVAGLEAFYKGIAADPPRPPPPAPPPQPAEASEADAKPSAKGAGSGEAKPIHAFFTAAAGANADAWAGPRAAARKGANGGKGMDLQYEEDVVQPPPAAHAGCGGALSEATESGPGPGSRPGPFDRFRMAAAPAAAVKAANGGAPAAPPLTQAILQPQAQQQLPAGYMKPAQARPGSGWGVAPEQSPADGSRKRGLPITNTSSSAAGSIRQREARWPA